MKQNYTKAFHKLIILLICLTQVFLGLSQNNQQAFQALKQYVSSHKQSLGIDEKDAENLFVTYDYVDKSTGIRHIYAAQKLNGLTVINTDFSLHTSGVKQFVANHLISTAKYKANPVAVSINAKDAVFTLMDAIGYNVARTLQMKQQPTGADNYTVYQRNTSSIWDIPCRLVYYKDERLKTLTPAWQIQMMDAYKRHYWLGYINASTGKLIEKKDLIIHCNFSEQLTDNISNKHLNFLSEENEDDLQINKNDAITSVSSLPSDKYRVYDMPYENPIDPGAKHIFSARSGDTLSSPDGWHKIANLVTYNYSHGNNVWAFQDPSPGPLGGVPSNDPTRTAYPTNKKLGTYPLVEPFVFDYPIDLTKQPETYMMASIVNLFYWNNLMHDVFYYMGFDEASGNFQESNTFSTGTRGGLTALGADEVLAQAQDGGGTNNSNFLTLPDGTNGQMQMYLWSVALPDSLVQIVSSTSGVPSSGKKYIAVAGSLSTLPTANNDLYANPVLNKQLAIAQKNALSTVGTSSEGCSTAQQSIALPDQNVNGKIAVIDRGDCSFDEKVLGAQLGGAVGAIIVNNIDGPPLAMGGSDAPGNAITIPSVMISKADGDVIKAQLTAGATIIASLKSDNPLAPKRDGDIDNGVICHEYGHGISNRLTGGPNSLLPLGGDEQGGEGWSDFVALYMTLRNNDLKNANTAHPYGILPQRSIGNYVTYQAYNGQGIREYPYSINMNVNPATFGYIKRSDYSETHSVGFVWCTMLYDFLQNFIDEYGMNDNVYEGANPTADHNPPATAKGNNIAMRLIIEGMKLQPTNPTFVDERDAILKADTLLYNAQHACIIWKAFAKRGLGYSAVSGTNALGDETEAFDLPYSCDPTQKRISISKSGPGFIDNHSTIVYTITVKNLYPYPAGGIKMYDTLAPTLQFISATGHPAVSGQMLAWNIHLNANETKVYTVRATVNSPTASAVYFKDDQEAGSSNWTANASATAQWTYSTDASQAYSGSHYWHVDDYDVGGSNTSLQLVNPVHVQSGTELIFVHKYSTENGYDGGVVEVSEDGATWTYLPPEKFEQGGYKGIITTANNPYIGTTDEAAFTGASAGYVQSVAALDDYAGKTIYIRFRMTSDATGGSVANGGWWIDDVYLLSNRTELDNIATAITKANAPLTLNEGTNAYSTTSAFITAP
ncbi:MAG: M36 family metallopeptidase, partial [Parafilimonas sp.]|nr:M36 family metallopeptidase [Parafilimonas sp.]